MPRWAVVLFLRMVTATVPMCHYQSDQTCYVSSKPMSKDTRCMQVYKTYPEGKAECEKLGMSLAVITSAQENEIVRKICGEQACYIGLKERPNSEDWVWVDGTALTGSYQNWYPGQPNNWRAADAAPHIEEDTAAMNCWKGFDGRWCDLNGTQGAIGFVCQSAGSCPAAASVLDACELVADDSLPNIDYNFTATGLTCEKTPTMNDGGSFCWKSGASSCYIGARQAWSGSCLKGGKIFQQGRSVCRVFGGDLVKISSAAEQAVVQEACGDQMCWIGLSEAIGTESWTWWDKTGTASYDNWAPGQPDNGVTHGYDDSHWNKASVPGYDETAAVMNLIPDMDGKWRDTYETARFGFVCKVPTQICNDAATGNIQTTTEQRANVRDVLMQMKECSNADPMVSTSINVFSFETMCEKAETPSSVTPAMTPPAATPANDDGLSTGILVLIICLAVFSFATAVAAIVFFFRYRSAQRSIKMEASLATTNYGNSA